MRRPLVLLSLLAATPLAAQQYAVDTAGSGAIIAQATQHSEVMKNLQYLADMIGPRLTGSPAMKKSNDWTAERFKAYGLAAHLESWNFGVTWERGPASFRITAPFERG